MYSDIAANKRRTIYIMVGFLVLVAAIAWLFSKYLGGGIGVFYGVLIAAIIYSLISYYAGSKMSLAVNRARQIERGDNPRLFRIIENLAITDGLPMPKVYVIDDPSPNAFATGRNPNNAAVCATSGLLDIMNDDELQGVFAHELGHVKNYDVRVNMIAFALGAVISIIADVIIRMTWFRNNSERENNQYIMLLAIVAAILAPLIATLIQLAVSRQREYLADATGALTTRYPDGLISALRKIEQTGSTLKHQNTATAHFFFANPLRGHNITNLFSTHPPIEARIKRLEDMGTHA